MARKWFPGSVTLSKLKDSFVFESKSKSGEMVKCIAIPLKRNYISEFTNENGTKLDLNIRIGMNDETDAKNQIAMVTQSVDSKTYKSLTEEEKEKTKELPILGNLFDFNSEGGANRENSVQEVKFNPSGQDALPF